MLPVVRASMMTIATGLYAYAFVEGSDPQIRIPCMIVIALIGILDRILWPPYLERRIIARFHRLVRSGYRLSSPQDRQTAVQAIEASEDSR